MSHPSIYIELRGKTSHVPPRYIRPGYRARPPRYAPRTLDLMVRYSRSCIRHTEFGIRKPEIGNRPVNIDPNQVHRNLHGAVFSHLTTGMMVR
jgi:hypothetical protein